MYASFSNHLFHGVHYLFAFILLFWLLPKVMFQKVEGDFAERSIANFMKMVLFIIAIGYVLVVTKLFEMLTILAMVVVWIVCKSIYSRTRDLRNDRLTLFATNFFEYTEGRFRLTPIVKRWFAEYLVELRKRLRLRFVSPGVIAESVLLLIVIVGAIYVRFYDAIVNAAPGMSDAYVVLEWMKNIDNKQLFNTGIYPKGFHIYLDTLLKFANINAVYIQKYSGPLDSLLIMLSMYFMVSRFTMNKYAGIATAVIYGWLGFMIGGGWERQAATNSQEFAMVFLFPSLYYFRRYLRTADSRFFWTASSGLIVLGLVHQLIYAYLCMGIVLLCVVHCLEGFRKYTHQILWIALAGVGSVLISVIPAGIGFAMGKTFQAAAGEFLLSQSTELSYPMLHIMDYLTLLAIGILFAVGLTFWKNELIRTTSLFTALFSSITFILYYWGGILTHSVVIASRMVEFWSLVVPVTLGMTWGVLTARLSKRRDLISIETVILAMLMAIVLYLYPLKPIVPYKMEWNSNVEQYLRISENNPNQTWTIYSQKEGYGLILGTGVHSYIRTLLKNYDPTKQYLTLYGEDQPDQKIPNEIYIFAEKQVFRTHFEHLASEYDRREKEMIELEQWINTYKEANGDIKVYYEDEHIRIYYISRPVEKDDNVHKIWGD
jgi:hypothetical protein